MGLLGCLRITTLSLLDELGTSSPRSCAILIDRRLRLGYQVSLVAVHWSWARCWIVDLWEPDTIVCRLAGLPTKPALCSRILRGVDTAKVHQLGSLGSRVGLSYELSTVRAPFVGIPAMATWLCLRIGLIWIGCEMGFTALLCREKHVVLKLPKSTLSTWTADLRRSPGKDLRGGHRHLSANLQVHLARSAVLAAGGGRVSLQHPGRCSIFEHCVLVRLHFHFFNFFIYWCLLHFSLSIKAHSISLESLFDKLLSSFWLD